MSKTTAESLTREQLKQQGGASRRGEGNASRAREEIARARITLRITMTLELIECGAHAHARLSVRARRSRSARVGGAIGPRLGLVWPDLAALLERSVRAPCRACGVHLRLGGRT